MGLLVNNRLMKPLKLTDSQNTQYQSLSFLAVCDGHPFPEDLSPKHAWVEFRVPLMTLVSCLWDVEVVAIFGFSDDYEDFFDCRWESERHNSG